MKLFALLVMYKDESPTRLKAAFDVSSFSFFQRSSVQDFMGFTAKLMAERTQIGDRQSISEGEYMCHVFVRADSLIGVCLSDQEYPKMVAHKLLTKVLDDFTLTVPRDQWTGGTEVAGFTGSLEIYIKKYMDPCQVDPMMKMEKDLDETKIILHRSIEAVLERDEKLHDLVAKSDELSEGSKMFYKTVPKQGCCSSLN